MKTRLLVSLMLIVCVQIYSLEVNIVDVSYDNKYFQINIEISSNNTVFIPQTSLQQLVTTGNNPLTGKPYQIFYAFLIKSGALDTFALVITNENMGITRYLYQLDNIRLTLGNKFIPFNGKKSISIVINKISMPQEIDKTEFIIEEIFFNYCYSNDERIMNSDIYGHTIPLSDVLKNISSVVYRLPEPILYEVEMSRSKQ